MDKKKENKNTYKQMKFKAGIFQIKNTKNNKLFLQTSEDLDRAFNSDIFQLKAGVHSNAELQSDWNAFGAENFELSILDDIKTNETATPKEIKNELKEFLELHRNELMKNGIEMY